MSNNLGREKERLIVTALLLLIFMLGMGLRLYSLDADSLWADEIFTAEKVQHDLAHIVSRLAAGDNHAQVPLTFVVTRILVALLGDSESVLRLQAALFGTLSILLAYKLGQVLWGRREGLVGALLLTVAPYHIRYSQEARHYALMVVLALLSLIFLLKALRNNDWRFWTGFALCTSLSLYNHYFSVLFLPAELIFAVWTIAENWLSHRRKNGLNSHVHRGGRTVAPAKQAFMFLASVALVAVSFLPWLQLPVFRQYVIAEKVGPYAVAASPASLRSSLTFLESVIGSYNAAGGGMVVLWLVLSVVGLVTTGPKRTALALLWVATPFVALAVVTPQGALHPRYLLYTLPLYLLLIGRGIVASGDLLALWSQNMKPNGRQILLLTSSVAVCLALTSVAPLRSYYRSQKEDWRSAARYLADSMVPGDLLLVDGEHLIGGDAGRPHNSLSFYFARYDIASIPVLGVRRGLAREVAQNLGDGRGQVWAVVYHEDELVTPEMNDERVTVQFEDISIIRIAKPSRDLLKDTISMLHVLLDLLPAPETHFDVRLALADIHLRTGRLDQAQLQADMASDVMPDIPKASRRLERVRAELARLSTAVDQDIDYPLWHNYGLKVALHRGHDVGSENLQAGEALHLTLRWQALSEMEKEYTAFIHLVDREGNIRAQDDTLLKDGNRPTSDWEFGEIVQQEHVLQLPTDMALGDYRVQAGIYHWQTGERLPLWDEQGQRVADDIVALGTVTVTECIHC